MALHLDIVDSAAGVHQNIQAYTVGSYARCNSAFGYDVLDRVDGNAKYGLKDSSAYFWVSFHYVVEHGPLVEF